MRLARSCLPTLAALLVLTACGDETTDPEPRADEATPAPVATPTVMPTSVPVPDGPVTTGYAVTVLDDGDGAELCLGGVATSLPPQCGGPKLIGWDWSEYDGDFEDVRGVKWGDFAVTGTFDGKDFTPTEVMPADELEAPDYEDDFDLTSPCSEPEGGWRVLDASTTTTKTQNATLRAARGLAGYAGAWVDQSINPAYSSEVTEEQAMKLNDPALLVINVQVTGDPAEAEAILRETWGGALCVSQAKHTERELLSIQRAIMKLPGMLGGGAGFDKVDATVIYDDGTIQAWADWEYGADVVVISSALQPVG